MKSFLSTSTPIVLLSALLVLTPSLAHAQKKSSGLVTAEDIAKHPNDTLERIITRFVSGVQVMRNDNGTSILQIRGGMTIPDRETGEQLVKPPLYIVDGMAIHTPDGAIPAIDPMDLDSIRVLKGAETSRWGIEGGDGVVVFTTKRGKLRK